MPGGRGHLELGGSAPNLGVAVRGIFATLCASFFFVRVIGLTVLVWLLGAVRVLGAAPAPITRLRGLCRFHLQIAGKTPELVRELWQAAEQSLSLPNDIEFAIDVDPINAR